MLGLPGGQESPLFDVVKQAALESEGGMKLYAGRGDDPDTLGDKAVLMCARAILEPQARHPRAARAPRILPAQT